MRASKRCWHCGRANIFGRTLCRRTGVRWECRWRSCDPLGMRCLLQGSKEPSVERKRLDTLPSDPPPRHAGARTAGARSFCRSRRRSFCEGARTRTHPRRGRSRKGRTRCQESLSCCPQNRQCSPPLRTAGAVRHPPSLSRRPLRFHALLLSAGGGYQQEIARAEQIVSATQRCQLGTFSVANAHYISRLRPGGARLCLGFLSAVLRSGDTWQAGGCTHGRSEADQRLRARNSV